MSYWFKTKQQGLANTPTNWKGWAVAFGFLVVLLAFLTVLIAARHHLNLLFFEVWAAAFIVIELIFIWIAWKKTDGAWQWRSGPDDIEK
jgi:predicted lysophospholipase L1 biosynthesis ABC-type transport system permease subunit